MPLKREEAMSESENQQQKKVNPNGESDSYNSVTLSVSFIYFQ